MLEHKPIERKPIFDWVDEIVPGIWNRPGMIASFDAAIDRAEGVIVVEAEPEWIELAAPLIEKWEGYADKQPDGSVKAYPDPGSGGVPWTIGIGSTTDEDGNPIAPGTIWPRDRALARFKAHLREFGEGVDRLLGNAPVTPAQKAAMVSLAYNIGLGGFARSTVLRRHKQGMYEDAARAFAMWNKAGGRVMRGLVNRRADEAALYRSGTL